MTDLYRGMNRAALDRAYSPSSMVPNIDPYLARYSAETAAARAAFGPARHHTHAYGPAPREQLDLYHPAASAPPLLVFIHGGYWQQLDRSDAGFPAPALAAAGIAYAAIGYTLAPQARLDTIVDEVRSALAWLWINHTHLGIDRRRIAIAGHSAGAHLAAMLLATDWTARGLPDLNLAGAILIGGVYDLEPIRLTYVNDALGLDPAAVARNSPLFMTPKTQCPLVVTWAERDTEEFKRQSRALAAHWAAPGREVTMFEQPDRNHFDCLFDWCDPASRLFAETRRVLAK